MEHLELQVVACVLQNAVHLVKLVCYELSRMVVDGDEGVMSG